MIVLLLVGIGLAGLAAALIVRAVANPPNRSFQPVAEIERYGFGRRGGGERAQKALSELVDRAADRVGAPFSARFGDADAVRSELAAAGIYRVTPRKFLGYRVLAAVGLPLIWIWFSTSLSLSPLLAFVGVLTCAYLGWALPRRLIKNRGKRRLNEVEYELPELIDLLVVTVEAGLGFVGSLQLASGRLRGPLGQELRLALQEQSLGLSINEALTNTMVRCDTPSMRSFVRSITQGETLGVSIGQILRDLAMEMRRRRRQAAEERAQKAPVKILFPLVFLIFPAMFVVLLGPALIQFLRAIKSAG